MKDVGDRLYMRKMAKNTGSATIELTLIMPIILGVFYLYISCFLFMIESSKNMGDMVKVLYAETEAEKGDCKAEIIEQGSTRYVSLEDTMEMFTINLEFSCYKESAVENLRRWQLAFDTIRTGENE